MWVGQWRRKVEVHVRLLWNELAPSSGRIAQHPCHREGHMEVCRQWRLLFETDMSRNEPEGRKSHRGSIFLSICFKFWFTKKHSLFFKIQYYFWFCFIYICRLTWHVRVESVYHEWVMDGSHVLRLGRHMVYVFYWCRVVKNADLQRRDKHRYSGKSRWTIRRRHGVNDKERKRKMRRITKNKSTWREGRD